MLNSTYMVHTHGDDEPSVLFPGEKVCKWVRQILYVALSACQNLSLIVMGHCLHKADAFPKDMFCLVCEIEIETEGEWSAPEIKHTTFITCDCFFAVSQTVYMVLKWFL